MRNLKLSNLAGYTREHNAESKKYFVCDSNGKCLNETKSNEKSSLFFQECIRKTGIKTTVYEIHKTKWQKIRATSFKALIEMCEELEFTWRTVPHSIAKQKKYDNLKVVV